MSALPAIYVQEDHSHNYGGMDASDKESTLEKDPCTPDEPDSNEEQYGSPTGLNFPF